MRHSSKLRLFMLAIFALLPSYLKRFCYGLFFGYRIGKRVRIGISIVDARECWIDDVRGWLCATNIVGHLVAFDESVETIR